MSFFKKIGGFFKKLLKALKKILAVLLIIIAVVLFIWATICTAGATLVVFGLAITPTIAVVLGAIAITGAFLIDPKTSSKVVGKIGEAAGQAAGAIASATGSVVGGAIKGIVNSPLIWILGGGVAIWLLSRDSNGKETKAAVPAAKRIPPGYKPKASKLAVGDLRQGPSGKADLIGKLA